MQAVGDVFQSAHNSGVNLASSNLFTWAHYHFVASRAPTLMLCNLWGDSLFPSSLTLCPLFLHPEFLCPPFGLYPQLRGPCPPATPDHVPAGGAWHQRPFQADHRGPGGHSSSWLTEKQPARECRLAEGCWQRGHSRVLMWPLEGAVSKGNRVTHKCALLKGMEVKLQYRRVEKTVWWNEQHLCVSTNSIFTH